MYLSDMFVAAHKNKLVPELFKILEDLPAEWWEVRGCRNWLKLARVQYTKSPDKFMENLENYANGQDWAKGKPFDEVLDASV
jgi:hypothetical protein